MINKVCTSKKTTLINDDELWIDRMIGKGHYGQVYIGKYAGNQVAIKMFPDLDIHNIPNNNHFDGEREDSPLIAYKSEKVKSFKKNGYSSVDNNDGDDDDAYYDENDDAKMVSIESLIS